jgi:hypothetical protein
MALVLSISSSSKRRERGFPMMKRRKPVVATQMLKEVEKRPTKDKKKAETKCSFSRDEEGYLVSSRRRTC